MHWGMQLAEPPPEVFSFFLEAAVFESRFLKAWGTKAERLHEQGRLNLSRPPGFSES